MTHVIRVVHRARGGAENNPWAEQAKGPSMQRLGHKSLPGAVAMEL